MLVWEDLRGVGELLGGGIVAWVLFRPPCVPPSYCLTTLWLLDDHVCVFVCVRERDQRCWIIKKRKRSCSASVLPSVMSYCLDSCWGSIAIKPSNDHVEDALNSSIWIWDFILFYFILGVK